ncbi:MAG TPA: pyridoxal phosphate-dependent aminotransferase [Vicinamibacterales bacterium]|nr:pyridoxal phosphate-dependent aminotransferase [Vicinamibacterales bacterium]
MGEFLDTVPFSGIIRIRDMMYSVEDPFRLDQGDVSFDAPDTVKHAMRRAIDENRSHYLQTTGLPRLLELLAGKLRTRNGIPVGSPDEIMVTTGGIHALFIACQALLEPGDEVIVPDPEWPPCAGNIKLARGVPVPCPLREPLGWRYDLDELAAKITPKTRAIYLNSPHNPTGGVLGRADIEAIAALAGRHGLWILSDEAYEDVIFDAAEHVSPASLPGMYERTISLYTFSKTYAMTGLRLGYVAARDAQLRDRMKKALFYTASNIASVVQFGGIGALEGSQEAVAQFRTELQARRDLFYDGIRASAGGVLTGEPPRGAFYAFLRIDPSWAPPGGARESISWSMTEYLISRGRIGCVPGVDFGATGEGYVRFCFARDRRELTGALESMRALFSSAPIHSRPAAPAAAPGS